MPFIMSEELKDLKKYLDAKFDEINRRFNKNDEEHQQTNTHLKELNHKVYYNTCFRNQYQGQMDKLINDREHKIRVISDWFLKILLIGLLLFMGLERFIGDII